VLGFQVAHTHTSPTKIVIPPIPVIILVINPQFIYVYSLILDPLLTHTRAGRPLLTLLEKQTSCVPLMIMSIEHCDYRNQHDMLLLGSRFREKKVGLQNVCKYVITESYKCMFYLIVLQIQNGLLTISVYLYAHDVQVFIEVWELTSQKLNI
jgi:hypothetical protein